MRIKAEALACKLSDSVQGGGIAATLTTTRQFAYRAFAIDDRYRSLTLFRPGLPGLPALAAGMA